MVTLFQNTDLRRILCSSAAQSLDVFLWVHLGWKGTVISFKSSQIFRLSKFIDRSSADFMTVRDLLPEVPLQPLRIYDYTENAAHFFLSLLLFQSATLNQVRSVTRTEQNHYPLDVKARIQSDDSTSLASSASDAQYSHSSFTCTPASFDMPLPPKIQKQEKSYYAACLARRPSLTRIWYVNQIGHYTGWSAAPCRLLVRYEEFHLRHKLIGTSLRLCDVAQLILLVSHHLAKFSCSFRSRPWINAGFGTGMLQLEPGSPLTSVVTHVNLCQWLAYRISLLTTKHTNDSGWKKKEMGTTWTSSCLVVWRRMHWDSQAFWVVHASIIFLIIRVRLNVCLKILFPMTSYQ